MNVFPSCLKIILPFSIRVLQQFFDILHLILLARVQNSIKIQTFLFGFLKHKVIKL